MKPIFSCLAVIWGLATLVASTISAQANTLYQASYNVALREDSPGFLTFGMGWQVTGSSGNGTVDYTLTTDPPSSISQSGIIHVEGGAAPGIGFQTLYENIPATFFTVVVTPTSATNVTVASSYRIDVYLPFTSQRTLTASGGTVTEGNSGTSALTFTVALNQSIGSSVSFQYTTQGGTAVAGEDYEPVTGTATIPYSALSTTVTVNVKGDITVEGDETVGIKLSNFSAVMTEAAGTPGTILTDDFPPALLQQSSTSATVTEDAGGALRVSLPFRLAGTLRAGSSVNYSFGSTPDARLSRTGVMNFTPGPAGTQTIDLFFAYNELPGEDFHLIVTPTAVNFPSGQAPALTAESSYDFTLHFGEMRILTVSGGSVPEGNAGVTALPFTVSLNKAVTAPLTFTWSTTNGTAAAGEDYVAGTGTGTIAAGALTTVITISVTGDTAVEDDETLNLALSAFSLAVKPGAVSPGTILTDDFASGPVPAPTLVTEAPGTDTAQAWFAVNLAARSGPLTCRVSTRNGTALAGSDYRALPATEITFAAGETRKWVAITVTASAEVEGREEFFLDAEAMDSHEVSSAACTIERLTTASFARVAQDLYQIRFPGGLGQRYLVEEAASLAGPWTPASGLLSGAGAPLTQLMFSDSPRGFYRVRTSLSLPPGVASASS